MTKLIVSLLHIILSISVIIIVAFSYYIFYSFYSFNPIYLFFIYDLNINIDPVSFGFLGAILGFVFSAIVFGPLFVLIEINHTLKKSHKNLGEIEKNTFK